MDEALFESPGDDALPDHGPGRDDGATHKSRDSGTSADAGEESPGDDGSTVPGSDDPVSGGNPFTDDTGTDPDPAIDVDDGESPDSRTEEPTVEPETERLELDIDLGDDIEDADESNIPGGPLGGESDEDTTDDD